MAIKNKKIIKIILVAVCFLTLLPTITIAEEKTPSDYTLLEPLPQMGKPDEKGKVTPGLGPYLEGMFKIGIGVAGVLAVIMITIGGVQYMTTEAVPGKDEGKKRINQALFGLVLALSSYLLLSEIDSTLIETSLTLKPVPAPPELPLPVEDGRWYGYYKCGENGTNKLCVGNDFSSCQTNCSPICPGSPKQRTNCKEYEKNNWVGYCIMEAGGKTETINGTTKKICTQKLDKTCPEIKPILVQSCREAGGDPSSDEQ